MVEVKKPLRIMTLFRKTIIEVNRYHEYNIHIDDTIHFYDREKNEWYSGIVESAYISKSEDLDFTHHGNDDWDVIVYQPFGVSKIRRRDNG